MESNTLFASYLPIWDQLTQTQQNRLLSAVTVRHVDAGVCLSEGEDACVGLLLVKEGQLRAYMLSDEGREITLYRVLSRDFCMFSAGCMMSSLQVDITIECEKPSQLFVIPAGLWQELMTENPAVGLFTNEMMATRFSEVMWLFDQILWKSMDSRLAGFLMEESTMEGTLTLSLTHDKIARHLGTAREVVSRMLKYFESEGMISLSRGGLTIMDEKKLQKLIR